MFFKRYFRTLNNMVDDDFLDRARVMLESEEGKENRAYKCPAGKTTIGIGRNLDDVGISDDTIYQMLWEDLKRCMLHAKQIFGDWYWSQLSETRQLAIINMIFNLGFAGFLKFKDFIGYMKAKEFEKAAESLKHSRYAVQVPKRVARIQKMISEEAFPYE